MANYRKAIKDYLFKKLPGNDETVLMEELGLFSQLHRKITQLAAKGGIKYLLFWVAIIILGGLIGIMYSAFTLESHTVDELYQNEMHVVRYLGNGAAETLDPFDNYKQNGFVQINVFDFFAIRIIVYACIVVLAFLAFKKYYKTTE